MARYILMNIHKNAWHRNYGMNIISFSEQLYMSHNIELEHKNQKNKGEIIYYKILFKSKYFLKNKFLTIINISYKVKSENVFRERIVLWWQEMYVLMAYTIASSFAKVILLFAANKL